MAISKENKEFIENLIRYYIDEAPSYKQIAEDFVPEVESVSDTAFGIIVGNVYSEFMQAYQNQKKTLVLEDIQEFNKIMKDSAPLIKKAITKKPQEEKEESEKVEEPNDGANNQIDVEN